MINKYKTKREEGFTIIEVLIVLAIAGLIILIVFLAVPALQRNSRNTQRKNDVGRVGGAAQEILNNNNGSLAKLDTAAIQSAVGSNLAYYESGKISVADGSALTSPTNSTDVDTVVVYKGGECQDMPAPSTGRGVNKSSSSRKVAIAYSVESGSGAALVCEDQ